MPPSTPVHPGDGMDESSTPKDKVLPAVTKTLPLSETDAEVVSIPASARSSSEQSRSASVDKRASFPVEPPRSSDPRDIILKAFLPRVAVYASQDTEELVRLKGIYGGLCGLLRPFGETVQGKVGIRDSVGVSKSWEDYGVHFVELGGGRGQSRQGQESIANIEDSLQEGDWSRILKAGSEDNEGRSALDEVIKFALANNLVPITDTDEVVEHTPNYYNLFLRKILAERPLVSHDTFTHPVACVIAISSQTKEPIATLGDLYHDTRAESGRLPGWVSNTFLRYYVLVHDEDHDDINTSTGLFAQMKKHFGLHCHMLRLRSVECTAHDTDGSRVPESEWLTVQEDLGNIQQNSHATSDELSQYLFETDKSVIKTFVRELVTQSIIPFMENRVATWNEQVASRRRGMAGRLMSMSKRWTGFGTARARNSTPAADRDFSISENAYKPESPMAIMHKLADYAFMLRDWKLSSSIYDLLRSDFGDDKAWHHYASAHEMTAISMLLSGQSVSSRTRVETINQLLDTASYSFITRCSSPQEASRCMVLALELFINNAGAGSKEAARWGARLLELSILSPSAQVLLSERMAVASRMRSTFLDILQPSPYRKSALWNIVSAETWIKLGQPIVAEKQLNSAMYIYGQPSVETEFAAFNGTQEYLKDLHEKVAEIGRTSTAPTAQPETETFIEDLAPSELTAPIGMNERHRHSHSISHRPSNSVSHRRGMSHPSMVSIVPRSDDPLQLEDDGFS